MAANEGMAIRFHRRGDAADLANQLITILESDEIQHEMAEQNFAAGVEMTLTSVIKNYLRWFELNLRKREFRNAGADGKARRPWLRALRSRYSTPEWKVQTAMVAQHHEASEDQHCIDTNHKAISHVSEIGREGEAEGSGHQLPAAALNQSRSDDVSVIDHTKHL